MDEKKVAPKSSPTQTGPAPAEETAIISTPIDAPKEMTLPEPDSSDSPGPNVDTLIPTDPYYTDPLFYEVTSYFNIEKEEYASAKNKLSEIVDYVIKTKKSNAPEEVLLALREIENKIQPPSWDEKRYTNVYRYVRLLNRKNSLEKAMSAFEKNGN